jgi:hypothetical protein
MSAVSSVKPHSKIKGAALSVIADALSRFTGLVWLLESLVLSSRYQQKIRLSGWSRDAMFRLSRFSLWEKDVEIRMKSQAFSVLEFGVADGAIIKWWADRSVEISDWTGFDTFEGLPEAWSRGGVQVMEAGVFRPTDGSGAFPQVSTDFQVEWVAGLIEETLPTVKRSANPLLVFIDVDLLEPTRCILKWMIENGRRGDLIYFDEAHDPWNEGAALDEAITNGLDASGIAYSGSSLLLALE